MTKFKKRRVEFDIETGAEPMDVLKKFYRPLPEFSVDACKKEYATAREPGAKGEAFIEKKRLEHEVSKKEHWDKYVDRAALDPVTGRIFAIGIREDGKNTILTAVNDAEEKAIIAKFLQLVTEVLASGGIIEGFNIEGFDLRFIFRRGLKHGLNVHIMRAGRYWLSIFRDILVVWQAGDRTEFISLDDIAEFLGTEHRKNGDGAHFAELFMTDPEKAIGYLGNDLVMTDEVGHVVCPDEAPAAPVTTPAGVEDIPFEAVASAA